MTRHKKTRHKDLHKKKSYPSTSHFILASNKAKQQYSCIIKHFFNT
uniref:Uncharacterized protein n=1 Tax=Arundo donax TaxID=35708 RepID=A0A0A9CNP5_ARUDO